LTSIKRKIKLFDLNVSEKNLYRLTYPAAYFVDAQAETEEEFAVFSYDLLGLVPMDEMRKASAEDKLRFLANIEALDTLTDEFSFSLAPENIYVDRNLQPRILLRDLRSNESEANFLNEYRALAATLLKPSYSFDDYLNSGKNLFKKKKKLRKLLVATTTAEMQKLLLDEYEHEHEYIKKHKKLVSKNANRLLLFAAPIFFVLFLLGGFAAGYYHFVALPYNQSIIQANHANLNNDYDGVIAAFEVIDPMRLAKEDRYLLTRAYVASESLSQSQKQNVLSRITLKTEDTELLYWIYLGRLDYTAAIDTAQRMGSDELLMYALIKYDVATQTNTNLTGEEKTALLSSIGQQIAALEKKQNEKEAQIASSMVAGEALR